MYGKERRGKKGTKQTRNKRNGTATRKPGKPDKEAYHIGRARSQRKADCTIRTSIEMKQKEREDSNTTEPTRQEQKKK